MARKKSPENSYNEYRVTCCRICDSSKLYRFLDLEEMPIPNGFLTEKELQNPEPFYPLAAFICENCWLVQLTHVIPPEIMFKNYLYIPSTSTTMLEHFQVMALELTTKFNLSDQDLVIDIGSNDGTLLGYFKEQELKVLGIDPATNLAQVARLKGIDTIDDFFNSGLAEKVVSEYQQAAAITATNVFAHIHNIHDVINGIRTLLADNGVFVGEFPYLVDLLDKNEFDTIYHEHLSYFAVRPLVKLFEAHDMYIFDIKKVPIHGGSIRVFVAKKGSKHQKQPVVESYVREEILKKLDRRSCYDDFARRVRTIRRDLVSYLEKLKRDGKKIVGYGASAKGNVLLNYCKISTNLLDYIVDSIPYKQGKYSPGTHIPIYTENRLEKDNPDYALLLAWNFADEIIRKNTKFREMGGQFIITIPYLRIE